MAVSDNNYNVVSQKDEYIPFYLIFLKLFLVNKGNSRFYKNKPERINVIY